VVFQLLPAFGSFGWIVEVGRCFEERSQAFQKLGFGFGVGLPPVLFGFPSALGFGFDALASGEPFGFPSLLFAFGA